MKPDVLMLSPIRPDQLAQLEAAYTLHRYDEAADPGALLAAIAPRITAATTSPFHGFSSDLLAKLPALRIVASSGVGYDSIDVAACTERGVTVTNTPDVLTDDVADLAIGLMIATWRDLVRGDSHVRSGDWGRQGPLLLKSTLTGKRLGIVGLGRIGRAIARRAEPMGLVIGYCGRNRQDDVDYHYERQPRDLAAWADILVVAVPGGAETTAIIDAGTIDAVGPAGALINIARGSVMDEPALIDALRSGRLGGAGLDVFLNEPNPDPAFRGLANVVLHPHHASGTVETRGAMAQLVVDNLAAFFRGAPLLTPVN